MQTGNFISEDANYQFNRQMLFKLQVSADDILAFDLNEPQPDTSTIHFISLLGQQDFEGASASPKDSLIKHEGTRSAFFTEGTEFNDIVMVNNHQRFAKGDYIRISFWARVRSTVNHYRMGRMVVQTERDGHPELWKSIRIHNKLLSPLDGMPSLFGGALNEWQKISFFTRLDKDVLPQDILKVYGWNPYGADFWIDDLRVDQFRKR